MALKHTPLLTYYEASAQYPPEQPALYGRAAADVCVVGAGLAGLSAALHLAERGYRVRVLEGGRMASGASGRNGGQALPGVAASQPELARLVGPADARTIWDVSVAGLELMRRRIARHRIDCHPVDGHLLVATRSRHLTELTALHEEMRGLDCRQLQRLDRAGIRQLVASDRYLGALYDGQALHLHPLRYALGLARACQQAGVVIHENTRALDWRTTGEGLLVRTREGELQCRQLLLAGNALLGHTAPALARKLMAIGTYMVATEPLGEARARALITNNAAVADQNWIIDYFRRSADHRLLFGGRVSYGGLDPQASTSATRQRLLRVFPQLSDARIEYSWGGYLDITLNRAPHFGRLAPDVWFLQGFSGHGLALTGIAGQIAAEAMAGSSERFDVFARIPHRDFPGGRALRRPALMLAMLWYRLRDLL